MPLFGWLLCLSLSIGGHLWSRCFYISFISLLWIVAQFNGTKPPTHSNSAPPLQSYSYCKHQLSVGCCVFLLSFCHLSQSHHFLSISRRVLLCAPQTSQPMVAPPNQSTGAWHGTIGGHGAMFCGRRWPTHGVRGYRLRVEWWRLILVVVCFMFCVVVLSRLLPTLQQYLLCRKLISKRPKWPIFARS